MDIKELHHLFLQSSGICTDTRKITKNCLFFSLKGENFNGNMFAENAIKDGAYKVIVDEKKYHINNKNYILVTNCLETLQELAKFHRSFLNIPIIALTGSNGKTTSKELIHVVLSKKYKTVATKGNLNNHIGVPLTLLSMNTKTEIGIVEMGANHLKEIETLCNIIQPNYGYITNFGKAHLEGFGSLDGVIKAKTELYAYIKKNKETVFVNANDKIQVEKSEGISRICFGNKNQDCCIEEVKNTDYVTAYFNTLHIKSNLIGNYNFNNIAAAICIGNYFDIPSTTIKYAIEEYIPTNNRSQIIKKSSNIIILDAYNANPSSMLAALDNFKQIKSKNKLLFLGDMFELGNEAEIEHQNITNYIEKNEIGTSYLIGENFFKTKTNTPYINKVIDFEELQLILKEKKITKQHILIKASRRMALERILDLI